LAEAFDELLHDADLGLGHLVEEATEAGGVEGEEAHVGGGADRGVARLERSSTATTTADVHHKDKDSRPWRMTGESALRI